MSARCLYCGERGATFRVNADELAHQRCAYAADDADQALTLSMLGHQRFAPEEIAGGHVIVSGTRTIEDLAGQRFGRLLVLHHARIPHCDGKPRIGWLVRCDCGREVLMRTSNLRKAHQCQPCAKASQRGPAKVCAYTVQEMRRLREAGWTIRRLAALAGLGKSEAHNIVRGHTWRVAA